MAVLGWTARQVDELSLWELAAAIDGHNRSQGADEPVESMSDAEFAEMLNRNADWMASVH